MEQKPYRRTINPPTTPPQASRGCIARGREPLGWFDLETRAEPMLADPTLSLCLNCAETIHVGSSAPGM